MVECQHCHKKYDSESEFIEDSFVSSDGWSWDYFHNCLSGVDHMTLHGYRKDDENAS